MTIMLAHFVDYPLRLILCPTKLHCEGTLMTYTTGSQAKYFTKLDHVSCSLPTEYTAFIVEAMHQNRTIAGCSLQAA